MANTFTPTTNAVAIPTVVAQEVIRLLPGYMGISKFVSKDVDWTGKDFQSYGNTLDIVKPGNLTVQDKTPGTPVSVQNATATKVSVTLNKHKIIAILEEDITKMLQKPEMQQEYAQRMAIKLAEQIDSDVYALHPSMTNVVSFTPFSTEAEIDTAYRALRSKFARLKVPKEEAKVLFQDTSVTDKLLSVTKYTSSDYTNAKGIVEGALNKIHGINNFETQLVPTTGSPVAYHNVALTKWGIVLASRPLPTDGNGMGVRQNVIVDPNTGLAFRMTQGYSMDDVGVRLQMDVLYGVAIADNDQVIEVESF